MNIKMLTFHTAKNYGAVLQAYALRRILQTYSPRVDIINYRPLTIRKRHMTEKNKYSVHLLVKAFFNKMCHWIRAYIFGRALKDQKFLSFEKDYLGVTDDFIFTDRLSVSAGDADYVVLGSDQIWNCRLTHYDPVYLGNIKTKHSCRLIAYAASIGNDTSSHNELEFISNYIKHISYVSVREETAQRVLSQYRNDISVVLDPVFLLPQETWRSIASYYNEKDYVLLYNMGSASTANLIAHRIANMMHIDIVEIFPGGRSLKKFYRHKIYPLAGPLDFIGLIANARYVVTSSFHGTAFAILFNKQFLTIAPGDVSSRVRDLLTRLDIADRVVTSVDDLPATDIDYSLVNARLDDERKKSIDFLEKALGVRG